MKPKSPFILSALWLAFALALLPALHAQPATPPAPPPAPAEVEEKAAPPPVAVDEEKPAAPAPAGEEKPAAELRELGAAGDKTVEAEKPAQEEKKAKRTRTSGGSSGRRSGNERISFGHDSTLAAGEQAQAVVSILGSSSSAGEVSDAVVSVIGNTRVTGGTVGDAAVAVMGNVYINGHVKGEVVAVMGNIELGPDAVVDGELVCIGGAVTRDAKASVKGNVQNIAIGGRHFDFTPLQTWFHECVLYARPLAFNAQLWWAWCIGFAALGFYALLALVAPAGVVKCAQTLEEHPGFSLLSAVLTLLLTPVAYLLLVLTLFIGVGFVLIPLFSLGLFIAALFGKVVMLTWLGRRITKIFGDGPLAHPFFAVLIGGLIVLGLYTVPILGFVLYKLIGFLGLGVVIYTLLLMLKSNRTAAAAARAAAVAAQPPVAASLVVPALPPVISAATLPRVGFWFRILASGLDAIIVGIAFGMIQSLWHGFGGVFPFWYAVYCVVMWATKGTTVGGIICGLKLVRLDDRPVTWSVAIVRALGAFLSLVVAGLGFIWVAFDDERQSWHDKIAGTTIVRVPKGTPLL
ncbi:MAG: RDD family protein [Lacunisphaera sp.]|nr:RDD family protein [Lacunisphaera sp.]